MFYTKYIQKIRLFRKIFKGPEGIEALKYLAQECGAYEQTYVKNDALTTAFNEGRRSMYLLLIKMINQDELTIQRALQQEQEQAQIRAANNSFTNARG